MLLRCLCCYAAAHPIAGTGGIMFWFVRPSMRAFPGGDILWPSTSSYSLLLCSSVAAGGAWGGGTCSQPQSAGSWELPKSEEKKIGGGGTGSSWPNKLR